MWQRHSDTRCAASPGPSFPENEEEEGQGLLVAGPGAEPSALSAGVGSTHRVRWGRVHTLRQALGRNKHCAFAFQMRISQALLRGKT